MDRAYLKIREERTKAAEQRRKDSAKKKKPAKQTDTKTDTPSE